MNREPYIGMPIVIGSRQVPCESCNNNMPRRPNQNTGAEENTKPSSGTNPASAAGKMGCGPLGDVPQLNWQGGSAGNAGGFDAMYLGSLPLASSYVPFQQWKTTYTLEGALQRGTIFPELDLPFKGGMN